MALRCMAWCSVPWCDTVLVWACGGLVVGCGEACGLAWHSPTPPHHHLPPWRSCTPCPRGALCPGGLRAWPLPGYWSSSGADARVQECAAPSSRCLGWRVEAAQSVCNKGYRGVACVGCAAGYYPLQVGSPSRVHAHPAAHTPARTLTHSRTDCPHPHPFTPRPRRAMLPALVCALRAGDVRQVPRPGCGSGGRNVPHFASRTAPPGCPRRHRCP
jgi:hypothetical protein